MRHVILLPDLGQTTSEAKVLQWWKQPGEKVLRGEPLLSVETDKVDMDVESFADGYLRQALVESGAVATALKPVAILTDTPDETYEAISDTIPPRIKATPAAKSLARQAGIDLTGMQAARPDGLIVRKDLERSGGREERHSAFLRFHRRGCRARGGVARKLERAPPRGAGFLQRHLRTLCVSSAA